MHGSFSCPSHEPLGRGPADHPIALPLSLASFWLPATSEAIRQGSKHLQMN
jgi:hypothetical protein